VLRVDPPGGGRSAQQDAPGFGDQSLGGACQHQVGGVGGGGQASVGLDVPVRQALREPIMLGRLPVLAGEVPGIGARDVGPGDLLEGGQTGVGGAAGVQGVSLPEVRTGRLVRLQVA